MINRNICPICGSENPEGSEFCQVCKANLQTLPREIFPADPENVQPQQEIPADPALTENDGLDLDSPVPVWLKDKLKPAEKKPMDFDTFSDMLFGIPDNRRSAAPNKTVPQFKPSNTKKADKIYQPPLQDLLEAPLFEPDENAPKSIEENIPGIEDFRIQRPARKWEDRMPAEVPAAYKGTSISLLDDFRTERPAKKWDDGPMGTVQTTEEIKTAETVVQLPLWWQQDAPLVETDDSDETAKTTETDDQSLENSVSPTKVIDAASIFGASQAADAAAEQGSLTIVSDNDEYKPESGSLLSDLMNEINSSSGSLTPAEQQGNRSGTVFYSGNHPDEEEIPEPESDFTEITVPADSNSGNAEMLDRILRNIGYEVETEKQDETKQTAPAPVNEDQDKPADKVSEEKSKTAEETAAPAQLKPIHGFFIPQVIDNPLIPLDEDEEDLDAKDADPYDLTPEKEDFEDEQDIPWDLFGSADMTLPQSPEDPVYRTFSRSSLPEDPGSTSYQQRMISSILGKIIQAENYVAPQKEKNNRELSLAARLFWAFLAVAGVVFILGSNLTDSIVTPDLPADPESESFYQYAEEFSGNALVVMDYTPAFSSEMENAADSLLTTLENRADNVFFAVMNPEAMTCAQQLLKGHDGKIEYAGWWPAGVVSIRSRLSAGTIPEDIWLMTSESVSIRNWAEQLATSGETHRLHVMGPGQLKPLLKPYLASELVTSMLSSDSDLTNYGESSHIMNRRQAAVWYLCALVPLAWLGGIVAKMMKTEPDYGRKTTIKAGQTASTAENETAAEKEPENG